MTARDVLISRVHDGLGSPMFALSNSARDRVEELWAVTAEGKKSLTIHLFTEALDAALTWAAESGGEIYRRDQPGAEPGLYKDGLVTSRSRVPHSVRIGRRRTPRHLDRAVRQRPRASATD